MSAPFRKRQLSNMGCPESTLAYRSLLNLREEITESNEPIPREFKQQLDTTIALLSRRLLWEVPKSHRFFGMPSEGDLNFEFNIKYGGKLVLKPNCKKRAAVAASSSGEDKLCSSANLYRHLQVLESQIPMRTVVSARAWVEAFFFRVSAMLPTNKNIILNNEREQVILSTDYSSPLCSSPISGFVDYYAAVVADDRNTDFLTRNPDTHILNTLIPHTGFFITEASVFAPEEQVPQAISEMYTCGIHLRKKTIRGALTNGRTWIFLLLKFNDDDGGASYMLSEAIKLEVTWDFDGNATIHGSWPDLIAAVLAYWVENSFTDFKSDDYFEVQKGLKHRDRRTDGYQVVECLNSRASLLVCVVTAVLVAVIILA